MFITRIINSLSQECLNSMLNVSVCKAIICRHFCFCLTIKQTCLAEIFRFFNSFGDIRNDSQSSSTYRTTIVKSIRHKFHTWLMCYISDHPALGSSSSQSHDHYEKDWNLYCLAPCTVLYIN